MTEEFAVPKTPVFDPTNHPPESHFRPQKRTFSAIIVPVISGISPIAGAHVWLHAVFPGPTWL